jgi:hypothetical protein
MDEEEARHQQYRPPLRQRRRRRQLPTNADVDVVDESDQHHCAGTSWSSFDSDQDAELSWEEVKMACRSSSTGDEDDDNDEDDYNEIIQGSIQAFCEGNRHHHDRPQHDENYVPPPALNITTTTYLQCGSSGVTNATTRISLDDRAAARAFCEDVLVGLGCSLAPAVVARSNIDETTEAATTTIARSSTSPSLTAMMAATAGLFALLVLVAALRLKAHGGNNVTRDVRQRPMTTAAKIDPAPVRPAAAARAVGPPKSMTLHHDRKMTNGPAVRPSSGRA